MNFRSQLSRLFKRRIEQPVWHGYLIAIVSVGVATGIRLLLNVELEHQVPFITYFPAIIFIAWYGGFSPALFGVGLSAFLAKYFFIPPTGTLSTAAFADQLSLGLFFFVGVALAIFGESQRVVLRRVEGSNRQLAESEARFQNMADTAPVMIWMAGKDKQRHYFNKPWLEFTGRTLHQEAGEGWMQGVHPDDYQRSLDIYNTAFEARREFQKDYRLRRADGEYRWVISLGVPRFAGEPTEANFLGYIGTCVDITDRKRLEIEQQQLFQQVQAAREQLRVTLTSIGDAVIATDMQGGITFMNEVAQAITGWNFADAKDKHLDEIFKITNEDTGEVVESPVAKVMRMGTVVGLANHTILTDRQGRHVPIDDSGAPIRDENGNMTGVVLVFRDIAERKQLEERNQRLQQLTTWLAQTATLEDVAAAVIEKGLWVLKGYMGVIAQLSEDEQSLEMLSMGGFDEETKREFARIPLASVMPITDSVRHGKPIWIDTFTEYLAQYPHLEATLRKVGEGRAVVTLPLIVHERTIGAIGLSFDENQPLSPEDRDLVVTFAQLCAQALDRARLYAAEQKARLAAQASEARMQFLAEASATLVSSLDYQMTLERVAQLAVSAVADWCSVSLIQPDGSVEQVVVSHRDPEKVRWVTELRKRYPPDPNATTGVYQVIRTQQPEFYPEISDELLVAGSRGDAELLKILRELGFTAAITVPLIARDQVLGVLSLVSAESGRRYTEEDFTLATELARRAAYAIDNALLYQEMQLQRERLRVTLSSIGDAVIATDTEGYITFMNTVAQVLTGWQEQEAQGRPLLEIFNIVNEATREPVENPVEKVMKEQVIIGLGNHTALITRDGREIAIDDSGAPIRDEDGSIIGIILVFRDITERRQTEASEREQRLLAEALRDTAVALNSSLELSEVLDRILENVDTVIPHDAANIIMIEDGVVRVVRTTGYLENGLTELHRALKNAERSVTDLPDIQRLINDPQPLIIPDIAAYTQTGIVDLNPAIAYLGAPIIVRDEVIGLLNLNSLTVNFYNDSHAERLQVFASQAAIAIQNARLHQQAQALAIVEERQRLARDLHDAVSQMLFSSSIIAEALPRIARANPEKIWIQLERLQRLNRGALAEMRTLLLELRAVDLMEINISELLHQLAEAAMGHSPLNITLELDGHHHLPHNVELTFYRIAQEALNNTVKHAHATQVDITLTEDDAQVQLQLRDNGRGFDPGQVGSTHLGLNIMRERAAAIGAELQVSSIPKQGTVITVIWLKSDEAT